MTKASESLAAAGVAVWLDDLSRPRINSGELSRMVMAGEIVGITTNPTIFSKSISAGTGYEDHLRELALRGTAIGETLRLPTAWDVRAACDILKPSSIVPRRGMAGSLSRSTRVSPATQTAPRPRPVASGGWSTDRTCSSRSRRHGQPCRRSLRASLTASASTSP